ncbi:MAG TPA: prepilin-type cleavage/methylation domain-containing protein [Candidatus Eisenbacteria bacterium]|nr:prepilin-type cleavage/methylation domain-containing protein [Candidatus Eisenbacteria bacterium]
MAEPATPAESAPEPVAPLKPKKRSRVAFYSVVVVIILLLVAIAIPNFVKARTTACKNACIANLKQIDGAVQQWALEHKKQATDQVTTTDILEFLKGSALPICPVAGTYSVSTVSSVPTCSDALKNLGSSHTL